jgi:hypothetical protein
MMCKKALSLRLTLIYNGMLVRRLVQQFLTQLGLRLPFKAPKDPVAKVTKN